MQHKWVSDKGRAREEEADRAGQERERDGLPRRGVECKRDGRTERDGERERQRGGSSRKMEKIDDVDSRVNNNKKNN